MSFWKKRKVVILNYDINENKKKKSNKLVIIPVIVFALFLSVWGIISISTTNNFISSETKKILSKTGLYTKPVENVVVESNDKNDIGNWTITKSAEWTSSTTAKVTLNLNSDTVNKKTNKDVIFIIDSSESMNGSRINKVKEETINIVNSLLDSNSNRVAVITYNDNSKVISDLTSDKETLFDKINSIQTANNTNYYAGLKSIYDVLENYSKDDRELDVIFITDGYPNKSTPNEKNIYKAIKEKYSYINIYGIQYDMNLSKTIKELKNISDEQWIANQNNIGNVIKEALSFSDKYEEMTITNYINTKYFKLLNEKTIITTQGTATLEDEDNLQKLTWKLNDKYSTGSNQTLTFEVTLKDNYQDQAGLYPIFKSEDVKYSINNNKKTITDYETPVLNTKYEVIYDVNSPKECSIKKYNSEEQLIFQNVNLKTDELTCDNYIFKGWEIINQDVKNINDNVFVMPGHDVTVRAIWTKSQLSLSMDGQVYQSSKIYKVLEDAANNKQFVAKYTGDHKDSILENDSVKDIYYYTDEKTNNNYTIKEKNNVLFANHCWQIIRTTDNGGVKLLYNGEPNENDECGTDRKNHIEIKNISYNVAVNLDWYYSSNYSYDKTNNKFKLSDDITKYDSTNYLDIVGKYTCGTTNSIETCSTLYYVDNIVDASNSTIVLLSTSDNYNQIGSAVYNKASDSLAYIGYKYGDAYKQSESSIEAKENITNNQVIIPTISIKNKQYLYSDSITYIDNKYTLNNPKLLSTEDEIKGKYTLFKTDNQSDIKVYQIIGIDNGIAYYVELNNGITTVDMLSKLSIGDLNNQQQVSIKDWYDNYESYKDKYICTDICKYISETSKSSITTIDINNKIILAKSRDGLNLTDFITVSYDQISQRANQLLNEGYKYTCNNTSTTCQDNELRLITSYSKDGYTYITNHYYGTSVEWNGTNYILQNTIDIDNYNNIEALENHHYVCLEQGSKICNKVAYIYGYSNSTIYYILLENGVSNINIAKENMLRNTNDSNAKRIVETWYKLNLQKYSKYIDENTIYCNNRTPLDNNNGWMDNKGSVANTLKFKGYNLENNSLDCPSVTDQFSYNNDYAKLNYPIGLATAEELALTGIAENKPSTNKFWTMTPSEVNNSSALIKTANENSLDEQIKVNSQLALRPVITLKENTEFDDGDGSTTNPYHINVEEE